jgi:hypothetical protein
MTEPIRKLYQEGLRNQVFNRDMKHFDPKNYKKPGMFAEAIEKHIYASTYYGWLCGKGEFKRSKYF